MRVGQSRGIRAVDSLVEGGGTVDTVDVARVVAEEETTDGGEGADDIGLPGDGSLDALNISGGVQARIGQYGGAVVVVTDAGVALLLRRHCLYEWCAPVEYQVVDQTQTVEVRKSGSRGARGQEEGERKWLHLGDGRRLGALMNLFSLPQVIVGPGHSLLKGESQSPVGDRGVSCRM